jgi:hypothetical protein
MINTREIAEEYRLSHWAQITRERAESGLSIKAFCREKGFHQNRYFYWQRKLREAACQTLLPEIGISGSVKAEVMPPSGWVVCEVAEPEVNSGGCVCVEVGKFKVTVKRDDDMSLFADVCRTLVSLC